MVKHLITHSEFLFLRRRFPLQLILVLQVLVAFFGLVEGCLLFELLGETLVQIWNILAVRAAQARRLQMQSLICPILQS